MNIDARLKNYTKGDWIFVDGDIYKEIIGESLGNYSRLISVKCSFSKR